MNAKESLARVRAWQPVTNAFSQIWDEPVAVDDTSGPLAGVPVAVKDLFDVAGHPTTGCSAVYAEYYPDRDADIIRRLKDAGAVIVGKTNMHELAMGATNLISACGPTRNPWDVSRITGGSSGGSGAAVASGSVPMALGTDTGGSIRIPSSFCGCFGLKPTGGRLPLDGILPLAPSLDCPGPMAATVADLELLWRAISGDPAAGRAGAPARVGLLGGPFGEAHPDVAAAMAATADALRALGSDVVSVDGSGIEDALEIWVELVCDEMSAAHPRAVAHRELLHPRIAGFLARGINMTEEEKAYARRRTREISLWFEGRIADVDVLLAPATPYPAPRADEDDVDIGGGRRVDVHMGGTSTFTRPVSLSGLPAIAVPAGRTDGGLPVGVQLIAKRDGEAVLIRAALALESHDARFRTEIAPLP